MPNTVACGQCGKILNEPSDLSPEKRTPCPQCGSQARVFSVTVTGGIVAGGSATVRVQAPRENAERVHALLREQQADVTPLEHIEDAPAYVFHVPPTAGLSIARIRGLVRAIPART